MRAGVCAGRDCVVRYLSTLSFVIEHFDEIAEEQLLQLDDDAVGKILASDDLKVCLVWASGGLTE